MWRYWHDAPTRAAGVHTHLQQQPTPDPTTDWETRPGGGKDRVRHRSGLPPFGALRSTFELDGFDIALAPLVKKLGVAVEFNDFAFDGVLHAVRQCGRRYRYLRDAGSSAGGPISPTFTHRQQRSVKRTTFTDTITSAADLAGQRGGVERHHLSSLGAGNAGGRRVIVQDDLVLYSTPSEIVICATAPLTSD
ncbi:MAG: hypothetical protein IPK16_30405 [Anaerolineales bacterium]|nr:hypothetical protein [Anaerolineales bacterium]